ncbi:hypothetical protein SCP_0501390 [Sparassis crispa]|uniref:Uncharacterized protein n=1 Tax=Sparassis crispa TaxID=139825 RepID=A0A401GLL9_9APHY|nr:hypothetical protein SCP_0501390 [Sparassis crispa]GBE83093.1 hypothetical protein SCP_0501390 [Sparassis crispa]
MSRRVRAPPRPRCGARAARQDPPSVWWERSPSSGNMLPKVRPLTSPPRPASSSPFALALAPRFLLRTIQRKWIAPLRLSTVRGAHAQGVICISASLPSPLLSRCVIVVDTSL